MIRTNVRTSGVSAILLAAALGGVLLGGATTPSPLASAAVGAGSVVEVDVSGRGGVGDAVAASINFTVVDPRSAGHLTVFECGGSVPEASTLNFVAGQTVANSTVVPVSADGKVCVYSFAVADVVADVTGWFPEGSEFRAVEPFRLLDTRDGDGSGGRSDDRFETLPVGAALPSGAECAERVRPAVEIRPENTAANSNAGSRANANNRTDWAEFDRVDGAFSGTTDEIIQWAACKWGIDEDIARAQIIKESYWYMSTNGDNGESWGLGQVRDTAHESAFEYSVNARNSSAYNLDYTYASWRACYEGVYGWLNTVERNGTYVPGDVWGCVGLWFSGRWYVNTDAYLDQPGDSVRWHYENRTWESAHFIAG